MNLIDKLAGELVRLVISEPERDGKVSAVWSANSEYMRLAGSDPSVIYQPANEEEHIKRYFKQSFTFAVQTLEQEKVIGMVDLAGIDWSSGDGWMGVGIGEPEYWGRGYGTDAVRLITKFGFEELNLHHISLNVFEYNPRAIRSYEKVGYKVEGRCREWLNRDGRRWDLVFMGILKEEWLSLHRAG